MPSRFRLLLGLTAVLAAGLALVPLSAARTEPPTRGATAMPTLHRVTLLTGDTVHVTTRRNGKRSISLEPGPDGTMPEAAITQVGEHAYVVPRAALPLLAAHRLDLELFDVAALIDQRYDDEHRSTLPVIVDYGARRRGSCGVECGPASARTQDGHTRVARRGRLRRREGSRARLLALADRRAQRRRRLDGARGGATRVDLDGRVRAAWTSVAQIHAPEAWAAGFDGAGTTVAVLDTGYDPSHPDLPGPCPRAPTSRPTPRVVDGNGHGTHVASTIAGTGAGRAAATAASRRARS